MSSPTAGLHDAAYQGRPGAYSEAAARRLCGPRATFLPCDTLRDVFLSVSSGRAESAVVPVENSLAGAVPGALDLLIDSGFVVHGEAIEPIDHVLAAPPGTTFEQVREALSHPVALAQCEGFFRRHPQIAAVPVFDTAGALELLARERDGARAAIASRAAAALHGAVILAEDIQDHRANYTRFFRVGPPPALPPAGGPCRLIVVARTPHRPGALAAMLQTIASFGVNLTRIDSRPVKSRPFEYEFFLEAIVDAATDTDALVEALGPDTEIRILGRFGRGPAIRACPESEGAAF